MDFHFLAPVLWPTEPEASSQVNETYLLLLLPITTMELDLKESQPKNMRNKVQGVKKASNLEIETLGTKRGWSSPWFLIPSYTQIKMRPKKYYHRNLKNHS